MSKCVEAVLLLGRFTLLFVSYKTVNLCEQGHPGNFKHLATFKLLTFTRQLVFFIQLRQSLPSLKDCKPSWQYIVRPICRATLMTVTPSRQLPSILIALSGINNWLGSVWEYSVDNSPSITRRFFQPGLLFTLKRISRPTQPQLRCTSPIKHFLQL